ncbi:MAG: type II secretion system F family protein [Thermoanaerobaculia bacterium]
MQFVCRFGTPDGQVLTEVHEGSDAGAVERELVRQGNHVFEVRPRGISWLPRWGAGGRRKRMPSDEFMAFNQELAALLHAGLPLLQSLDMMLERFEDPSAREVLTDIRDRVRSGEELSEAFARYDDMFPPLYASTLKAGERTGELETVIRRFVRYLSLVLEVRRRVISALVYPLVLIGLSILMMAVMAIYVVPKFSIFYEGLDAELPQITQITIGASVWLRGHWVWVLIGLAGGYFGLRSWIETPAGLEHFDRWRLKIPIVGRIFHLFALSEFCRALATLIAGGLPLVAAFEIAVRAVGNKYVSKRIEPAIDEVRQGQAFNDSLYRTGIFPKLAIDMVKVGEATGSLDEMLNNISDYFDQRVETRVQRMLSLVEPIMLVIMGILVAVLLISIYLPMFSALGRVGT